MMDFLRDNTLGAWTLHDRPNPPIRDEVAQQRATAIHLNREGLRQFFRENPERRTYTLATMGGTYLVTRDEVMNV